MKFLLIILFLALVAWIAVEALSAFFNSDRRAVRQAAKESKKVTAEALTASRERERIATKALRAIANGAGNPLLEATDALDSIEKTYESKEIA